MDLSKFTQNAQQVIINCRGLLKQLDHSTIDPEHILYVACTREIRRDRFI